MAEAIGWEKLPDVLRGALAALKSRQDEINRLNVYPVPDGDTGTNMVLTMECVCAEAAKAEPGMAEVAKAATFGSLMGARGNSGVILSQIIRGFFEAVGDRDEISTAGLVDGLKGAVRVAYQAVKTPVEGTMLTVLKDAAEAVSDVSSGMTVDDVIELVVHAAEESLKRTPELLPVLKEAGVVDAGGYGLVVMGKGMLAVLRSTEIGAAEGEYGTVGPRGEQALDYTYCTELVVKGEGLDKELFEKRIEHLGDSMLVVGTPDILKVHIHTDNPGQILEAAVEAGSLSHIQINNMVEQAAERSKLIAADARDGVGVVAVVSGVGVKEIFESLGVKAFVNGGQSMNPSTSEILEAVDGISTDRVVILPNNKNVVLAAEQVATLTEKRVAVVATGSIIEGLSAMLGFNPNSDLEDNRRGMSECASDVKTGEVTVAIRDVNGVKKGDFIAMFDGGIAASGDCLTDTALSMIEKMIEGGAETVTILAGDVATDEQVAEVCARLVEGHPELDVDVHRGDQPVYHLVVGVE